MASAGAVSQIIVICYCYKSVTSAILLLAAAAAATIATITTTIDFRSLDQSAQHYNHIYIALVVIQHPRSVLYRIFICR